MEGTGRTLHPPPQGNQGLASLKISSGTKSGPAIVVRLAKLDELAKLVDPVIEDKNA